jgi:hypothetical protein
MAFLDHNGESEFPIPKDKVFEAMCRAIPTIKGMQIETSDKLQGRIVVKGDISLWSWGENIPIQLIELSENKTRVLITSSPKTGIMFGGAMDMGKNRKNIEDILSATSQILSNTNGQFADAEIDPQTTHHKINQMNLQEQEKINTAWYEKKWMVVLWCILFFPVGLYALWKNSSISKGWKVGVTILFALIIIANIGGKKESEATSSSSSSSPKKTEPSSAKQWTEVFRFKGNGMKKSSSFELTGAEARLKYAYKAPSGLGMGVFSAYVVKQGVDIMKTGGVPEVMTQAENENSESAIQKSAGRYYLDINASGNWDVSVEELK